MCDVKDGRGGGGGGIICEDEGGRGGGGGGGGIICDETVIGKEKIKCTRRGYNIFRKCVSEKSKIN